MEAVGLSCFFFSRFQRLRGCLAGDDFDLFGFGLFPLADSDLEQAIFKHGFYVAQEKIHPQILSLTLLVRRYLAGKLLNLRVARSRTCRPGALLQKQEARPALWTENLYAAGGGQVPMQLVPQVWLAGHP